MMSRLLLIVFSAISAGSLYKDPVFVTGCAE
jgi:hypothetical protein